MRVIGRNVHSEKWEKESDGDERNWKPKGGKILLIQWRCFLKRLVSSWVGPSHGTGCYIPNLSGPSDFSCTIYCNAASISLVVNSFCRSIFISLVIFCSTGVRQFAIIFQDGFDELIILWKYWLKVATIPPCSIIVLPCRSLTCYIWFFFLLWLAQARKYFVVLSPSRYQFILALCFYLIFSCSRRIPAWSYKALMVARHCGGAHSIVLAWMLW